MPSHHTSDRLITPSRSRAHTAPTPATRPVLPSLIRPCLNDTPGLFAPLPASTTDHLPSTPAPARSPSDSPGLCITRQLDWSSLCHNSPLQLDSPSLHPPHLTCSTGQPGPGRTSPNPALRLIVSSPTKPRHASSTFSGLDTSVLARAEPGPSTVLASYRSGLVRVNSRLSDVT